MPDFPPESGERVDLTRGKDGLGFSTFLPRCATLDRVMKEVAGAMGKGSTSWWSRHRGKVVIVLVPLAFLGFDAAQRAWLARYHRAAVAWSALEAAARAPAGTKGHLIRYAAHLLGAPVDRSSGDLKRLALARMAPAPLHVPGGLVVLLLFVIAVLGVYWVKEQALERLEADHRLLKQQLLAIAGGWASVATQADPREAMTRILSEVGRHTALDSAAVYRLTRGDRLHGVSLYSRIGSVLPLGVDVPRLFLGAGFGLVGDALQEGVALYSGDDGERGYLIPGVRHPRVAVFPLRFRDADWGVLLLYADERGWFYRYRDLLDVVSQEIAILGTAADLAEEARRTALYEELARVRSEIVANVSHELRTPLGLVKGYLETLHDAGEKLSRSERIEFLEVAMQETRELESLIDHLLLMSRLDSTGPELQRGWFAFEDWMRGIVRGWSQDAEARIQIHAAPGARVYGDRDQLKTALENLVQNALKYSSGTVEVSLAAESGGWTVRVADRGPGVPPGDLERIFERFYRAPGAARSSIRGSGLGLSIARRIVERHEGRVYATNRPKGGLELVVWLPEGSPRGEVGSSSDVREVHDVTR